MIEIPTKEDFFDDQNINNSIEVNYAIKKYLGMNHKEIEKYFEEHSIFWFLDDLHHMGIRAFLYYIQPVFSYLKKQSVFWDENYWHFDDRNIDDDAPMALDLLPFLLEEKIEKHPSELKIIMDHVIKFTNWFIQNFNKFNEECFIHEDIERKYLKLSETIQKSMQKSE